EQGNAHPDGGGAPRGHRSILGRTARREKPAQVGSADSGAVWSLSPCFRAARFHSLKSRVFGLFEAFFAKKRPIIAKIGLFLALYNAATLMDIRGRYS